MRTIIAGSRDIHNSWYETIEAELNQHEISVVLSGTARGVDRLGERYARERNIPIERYPADWNKHGKSAGYKRNMLMAEHAEALIAFWDGVSPGTKHMVDIAKGYNLKVTVVICG